MGHKCCFHNQRAYEQRRNYVACESAVRYERWNMATQKRQRKSQLIANKELAYLLSILRTIDATIMRASVMRLVRPGIIGKVQKSLDVFLSFLLTGFCDLLQKHKVVSRFFYDRGTTCGRHCRSVSLY